MRFAAIGEFIWWSRGILGKGNRKPIPSFVVMEIYFSFKEKEDDR